MPYFPPPLHCFAWKKLKTNFPANQLSSHILINKKQFPHEKNINNLMVAWEKAGITARKEGKYSSNPLLFWSALFTEIPTETKYLYAFCQVI